MSIFWRRIFSKSICDAGFFGAWVKGGVVVAVVVVAVDGVAVVDVDGVGVVVVVG